MDSQVRLLKIDNPGLFMRDYAHRLLESEPSDSLVLSDGYVDDLECPTRLARDTVQASEPVFDQRNASAKFIISTPTRDRYGDIVVPRGCLGLLHRYSLVPVVFFGHRSEGFPVGRAVSPETGTLSLEFGESGLSATCYFHLKTQESRDVCALVEAGELRGASIGFIPHEVLIYKRRMDSVCENSCEEPAILDHVDEDTEPQKVVLDTGRVLQFTKWELLEWSIVSIPANPDCVARRLSKGFGFRQLSQRVAKVLASTLPRGYRPDYAERSGVSWRSVGSLSEPGVEEPEVKEPEVKEPEVKEPEVKEPEVCPMPPQGGPSSPRGQVANEAFALTQEQSVLGDKRQVLANSCDELEVRLGNLFFRTKVLSDNLTVLCRAQHAISSLVAYRLDFLK